MLAALKIDSAIQADIAEREQFAEFTARDLTLQHIKIKPTLLYIRWQPTDDVSVHIRRILNVPYFALHTNGDGACGIHAIFGRAHRSRQITKLEARTLAAEHLHKLPELAQECTYAAHYYKIIRASLWREFIQPKLSGTGTAEGDIYWDALSSAFPDAATEFHQIFAARDSTTETRRHCEK